MLLDLSASHCVDVDRTRSARQRDSWQRGNDRRQWRHIDGAAA